MVSHSSGNAAIQSNGRQLPTTQAYIKGHPGNSQDMLYNRIRDDKARQSVTVDFVPLVGAPAGVLAARWDIVLGSTPTDDEPSKHEHTAPERPVPRAPCTP